MEKKMRFLRLFVYNLIKVKITIIKPLVTSSGGLKIPLLNYSDFASNRAQHHLLVTLKKIKAVPNSYYQTIKTGYGV
jgi:hypothetical protein